MSAKEKGRSIYDLVGTRSRLGGGDSGFDSECSGGKVGNIH